MTQPGGQLVRLALQHGWIQPQQAGAALQWLVQARAAGHPVRIGEGLVATGALPVERVHELLTAIGVSVAGCPTCRGAWNVPRAQLGTARCPRDRQLLVQAHALRVLGDLAGASQGVDDSLRTLNLGASAGSGTHAAPSGFRPAVSASNDDLRTLNLGAGAASGTHAAPSGIQRALSASHATHPPAAAHNADATLAPPMGSSTSGEIELAGYDVKDELARGGFGAIYVASDHTLQREVALKVLYRAESENDELRFLEEARVTGQLEHPNIVPVHDCGRRSDGSHFFTMKLVRGQSLDGLIKEHQAGGILVSLRRYLEIFSKVLDAVAFAHARGVIHRDLKPANIMLGEFGEVLVMDWGLAKVSDRPDPTHEQVRSLRPPADADEAWTMDGAIAGTPAYMSPEQADGVAEAIDERTDVYALGVILYELLTLTRPFSGPLAQLITHKVTGNYVDPESAGGDRAVPPELAAVIRKAMALEVEDRYESATALKDDIVRFLEGRAVSARKDPFLTRVRKFASRNRTPVAAGGVASLFSLGLLVYALLLPASLQVDLSDVPPDSVVRVGGRELGSTSDLGQSVDHGVWPAKAVELAITSPAGATWTRVVPLSSGDSASLKAPAAGTLKIDLSRLRAAPEGTRVEVQGDLLQTLGPRDQRAEFLETTVWPPGPARVRVFLPGSSADQPDADQAPPITEGRVATVVPALNPPRASLRFSEDENVVVTGLKGPLGDSLSHEGSSFALEVAPGPQVLQATRPGYFAKTLEVKLAREETRELPLAMSPMAIYEEGFRNLQSAVVADLDEDGTLDVVLAHASYLRAVRLSIPPRELWRRPRGADHEITHGYMQVADLTGDGRMEVVIQTKTEALILDGTTGEPRRRLPAAGCRIRPRDLDGDGTSELLVGTGYLGTQAWDAQGKVAWVADTGKYPAWGYLIGATLPGGGQVIVTSSQVPPRLTALDARGGVRWARKLPVEHKGVVFERGDGQSPLFVRPTDRRAGLIAIDMASGLDAWALPQLKHVSALRAGVLGDRRVLMVMRAKGLICLGTKGEELWRAAIVRAGHGAFGDLDGDGRWEWLQWCRSTPERKGARLLKVFGPQGKLLRELLVKQEAGNADETYLHAPLAVDLLGDGRPVLLHLAARRLAILRPYPDGTQPRLGKGGGFYHADLDHDGHEEVIRATQDTLVVESKSLSWKAPGPDATKLGRLEWQGLDFADFDGDGVDDVLILRRAGVLVCSGKDGELLLNQELEAGIRRAYFDPTNPRRVVTLLRALPKLLVRDAEGGVRVIDRPLPRGVGGLFESGSAVIPGPDPALVVSTLGQQGGRRVYGLAALSLRSGHVLWSKSLRGPAGPSPIVATRDRVVLSLALGEAVIVKLDQRNEMVHTKAILSANGVDLIKRRTPRGLEVVITSPRPELGRVLMSTGEALPTWHAPPGLLDLHHALGCAVDLDGDGYDELILTTRSNLVAVFDGETFELLWSTRRIMWESEGAHTAPPRIDAAGSLLARVQRGTSLIENLAAWVKAPRRARPPRRLELLPVVQALSEGRARSAHALAKGLPAGSSAALRARRLFAGSSSLLVTHMSALREALAQGEKLEAALVLRTRRLVERSPLAVVEALPERQPLRTTLLEHLRASMGDAESTLAGLLARAEVGRLQGRRQELVATLKAAILLFPTSPRARTLFDRYYLREIVSRQRAFDRMAPALLVEEALGLCETSRIHLAGARVHGKVAARWKVHVRRAMDLAPKGREGAWVWAHVADLLLLGGDAKGSAQALDKALELAPRLPSALALRARLQGRTRAESFADVDAALAAGLDDPFRQLTAKSYVLRGTLHAQAGRIEEGIADLRAASGIYGRQDYKRDYNLALQLFKQRRFVGAAALADTLRLLEDPKLSEQVRLLAVLSRARLAKGLLATDRNQALQLTREALRRGATSKELRAEGLSDLLEDPLLRGVR